MYWKALECDVSMDVFWNSSVLEIADLLNAFYKQERTKRREQISMLFILAELIGERHPMVDRKNIKLSQPWDFYPGLFTEEKEAWERQQEEKNFEAMKERRLKYFDAVNRQIGGE